MVFFKEMFSFVHVIPVWWFVQVKLEQSSANGPSRVVHIRSLPPDCTEADVVQLGLPYGKMSNVLLLKQKNQVGYWLFFVSIHCSDI